MREPLTIYAIPGSHECILSLLFFYTSFKVCGLIVACQVTSSVISKWHDTSIKFSFRGGECNKNWVTCELPPPYCHHVVPGRWWWHSVQWYFCWRPLFLQGWKLPIIGKYSWPAHIHMLFYTVWVFGKRRCTAGERLTLLIFLTLCGPTVCRVWCSFTSRVSCTGWLS